MSLLVNLQFNGCQNGYDLTLNHALSRSSCWGVLHGDFQWGPWPHTHTRTITLWHSCRQRARWVTSLECSCISCAAGPVLSSYIRALSRSGAIIGSVMCKCELIFLTNTHRHICNRYTVSNGLSHFMCVCFIIPILKLDLLHECSSHFGWLEALFFFFS